MPKRFWSQRQPGGTPFARRTRARYAPRRRPARFAGYYRKSGYYGRFGPGRRGDKGPELKFHDLDIDDAVVAAAGSIAEDSCVTIAQDTTESTRVGRKCTIRSINWRFAVSLPATAAAGTGGTDEVRVILYLDKQCNGATAAVTDVLESADFQSFNNLANKSRFRVLMDRAYVMKPPAAAGDGTTNDFNADLMTDAFFKKVAIPIEYDNTATTGAITTVRSNNIGVITISRGGLAGFESKMRLRFSDS